MVRFPPSPPTNPDRLFPQHQTPIAPTHIKPDHLFLHHQPAIAPHNPQT
ncbi:MAG: hypothetical protein ACK6C8_10950 [Pseudanabaena sp.]